MQFGFFSGLLWGLDTVILGIGLALAPYIGSAEALACASIAGSFLHDAFCAIWLFGYMGVRGRLKDTLAALKTRSGKVVIAGALLGGPIGMTGYVLAINNIGAAYTAIHSPPSIPQSDIPFLRAAEGENGQRPDSFPSRCSLRRNDDGLSIGRVE